MTAEELLVERYLKLEEEVKELKSRIEEMEEAAELIVGENADFHNLVLVLSRHITSRAYGVTFELRTYNPEDAQDIEYLKNYFDFKPKSENAENG